MFLPFIIAGLVSGSVYGLAGVGMVLTYKTSGIFNFAYGAIATVAAYSFYALHEEHHLAWPLAAAIVLLVVAPITGLAFERLAATLSTQALAVRVASTVGVLLIVQAAYQIIYGSAVVRSIPTFLGTHTFSIGGVNVSVEQIVIFAVSVVVTVGLQIFFRRARLGLAMQAVVDESELLDLAGTSPARARRFAWIVGTGFASVAGLMLASSVQLTGSTLTLLVVQAFGAAAIGSFASLPVTFIGGLGIGIAASLASQYFTTGVWAGIPSTLPFLVLFLVLLIFPKRRLAIASLTRPRARATWTTPWQIQVSGALVLLVAFVLVPNFAGIHLTDFTTALCDIVVFLSLGLLVRTSGQVSLGHIAFVAIGAATFSHLAADHHWPWGLALLATGLVAVPIGAVLAIPAIRLGGLYLALATFGFAILLANMFYTSGVLFGDQPLGLQEPRPVVSWLDFSIDKNYYYLVLAVVVLVTLVLLALHRSRLGRFLRAMADSPTALATVGVGVNVSRVIVFCLSAFLAAIAGALAAVNVGVSTSDNYQPLISLTYLVLVVITVGGEPWFAVQAALGLDVIPSYLSGSADVSSYLQILFGLFALLYAFTPDDRRGVPAFIRRPIDHLFRREPDRPTMSAGPAAQARRVEPAVLEVADVTVRFGGLVAANGVRLRAETGKIVGLIGPNGAGKTTTFNACSGLVRPSSGSVLLNGHDLNRRSPAARARAGLGRSFQQMQLFDSLSVLENVELGAEGSLAGAVAYRHVFSSRRQASLVRAQAIEALELCGLTDLAGIPVGSLSTGQRRLVELARCLAGPFRILLLDEPSSGLDRAETNRFGEILVDVVARRGIGVLLVEHDVGLVTDICDYVYMLDFGKMVFSGSTTELLASPVVRAAYLGTTGDEPLLEEVST